MQRIFFILLAFVAVTFSIFTPAVGGAKEGAEAFATNPDTSNIYIYRKGKVFGMAIPFQAFVDGKPVGAVANKKYRIISVPPGEHVVYVLAHENQKSVTLTTEAGENYYVRVGIKVGLVSPRAKIIIENEKKAQKDILKLNPSPAFSPEQ